MFDFASNIPQDFSNFIEKSDLLWDASDEEKDSIICQICSDIQQGNLKLSSIIELIDKICLYRPKKIRIYTDICQALLQNLTGNNKIQKLYFNSSRLRSALVYKKLIPNKYGIKFENNAIENIFEFYEKGSVQHALLWDDLDELQTIYSNPMFDTNTNVDGSSLIAKSAKFGSVNCFKFLFMNSGSIDKKALHHAFIGNNYEIIHICERQLKVDSKCLENSILSHHTETSYYLKQKYNVDYSWKTSLSTYNYRFFFEKLFQQKSVDERDFNGETALIASSSLKRFNVCEYLLKNKSNINTMDRSGFSALLNAAIEDNVESLQFPLKNNANIEMRDENQRTPLMIASQLSNLKVMELLIKNNADIEAIDKQRYSALMYAVRWDQTPAVKLLLDNGANINAKSTLGETPLYISVAAKNYEMTLFLLQYNPDIEIQNYLGFTPLMKCAFDDSLEIARLLVLHNADVSARDSAGYTPLIIASYNNSINVAQLLIENDVDVNQSSDSGLTPLMIASQRSSMNVAKMLIKLGADINKVSKEGNTALMEAISCGNYAMAKYLLRKGANASIINKSSLLALDFAVNTGRRLLIELVAEYINQ
ncbi:hypothetical protein TVAG_188610 [Trichomonas vaginalis G3]|uniref:DUF3447 domain-containing protein n=1 Tax=Trichomonas vaginalis (strain ATCC PRA-98 / G3) TaxID=412133 RepID=A2EEX6_TRIV3|nr:spectrin binding [Trichomonas vaginalis G3]EAY08774.1 hypothetical protein TVAG_188610 [Trichomonas vaginalis G3]KAI5515131.1 spectrin binding [Trichomonas vaginalis G3]|eukprot:XP_001320997.1 hypothetical protein [Trichomonas vaginalis G3]